MTGAGSINSIGLACLFDAHALRWRLVKLRQGGPGGNGDRDARTPRSRCHECLEEPRWSSRERLWTTDDPPRLDADDPPGLKIDDPPRRHADDPRRAETWARGSDSSPSDPPPSPSPPPPALAGAAEAEARTAAAAAEAAGEGRHAAPFLVDELMGMEQLSRVTVIHDVGYYHCSHCDDPESSRSLIDTDYVSPLPLPDALRSRLEQLSRRPQHVSALHMPVTVDYCSGRVWQIREMMGLARSCVNLRSLHLVSEPPRYASCPIHLEKHSVWGWKDQAQAEQMRQLITSCPHLRSLHFSLCGNNYLTMSEEVAALLSRLAHLSLPLSDLPPYLLSHLSSLRSLRLSFSAPHHPLLLSGRPFHSLSLLSLLHLSLGTPTTGLSEPLSPDLFAGLGPSLRSLTFLVCAKPKGDEGERRKMCGGKAQGGRDGGDNGKQKGGGRGEEEGGGWVGDGWAGEDSVVGWLPASLWSLTRLQQLTTNVGGEWHCTGLNALFSPHDSISPSCHCCCSSSSSSCSDDSTHPHQSHRQCLASLPNLTSLSLLAHRTFPPCLSSLSSLTLLSIPLASPLHSPASLALFAHWPRLSHLHVNGEGPAEPTFCHTKPATRHTDYLPGKNTSSASLRHVTLTGTAGVIPLAVWGRLCPQLQSLKIQGSPFVAVQGWGEASEEARGEGNVGQGACGEIECEYGEGGGACGGREGACGGREGACGGREGACGTADKLLACFFPFLEELVLLNVRSHACSSHSGQEHSRPDDTGPQKQQHQTLAFMGELPRLTHLAIQDSPWPSHPPMHAPTILPHLLPNLTFLRIHSPPRAPLPVLPHLRTLIVGSYPHSSRFLASLALFPALTALRIFNLSTHNHHSALSCPPHLTSLQICHSHTPLLPDCLRLFSSLTRLHLFQCTPLRALPSFLSSFSSLTHFSFDRPYNPVVVPSPVELARVRLVCREWHHWCRLHTSCFALALHPLTLAWLPVPLLHPPPSTSSSSKPDCSRTSHHETREAAGFNGPSLFSSAWLPSDSPFWVIHSSPTSPFSLLPSSRPPFTLAPHITPSSLSSCFTHFINNEEQLSPVWFASLPSPSSLAHTLAHYPSLSTLALPLVSTTACPLRPSHLRSLLAAAAALPALTSLSLLLEPGFLPEYRCGYGRQDWQDDWWEAAGVEANQEMERGLFAVLKRCRGLKQLHLQGETLTNHLKLPDSLFLRCPQLTALSLPLSRLPSSLLLLSRLTSLALALPADPMPPRLSLPSPFAHLRSLRSLSLHVPSTLHRYYLPEEGSSWSSVSDNLLLGLPSCLSALSLHLPTPTMPSSVSCLTSLTRLDTNLWIPGLDDDEDEEEEEEGVGEEEEREVMAEEARNVGEDEGGCVIADGNDGDGDEEEEQSNGFANAGVASRIIDESLLPLCNLTSLSLSHYRFFPPLIRHLTRLISLTLPSSHRAYDYGDDNTPSCSLHYGLSRLTRLEDLFLCCSDSACLPRLPRLRRLRVQCPDDIVDVARFIARVAPSLEQLDIRADRFRYSEGNLCAWRTDSGEWRAPVFHKLKVLQLLANSGDMALFPALEHMALAGNRDVAWKVENGFSANLRFLHLDCAKLSGFESEPQLTQLTALTTLVVDNADCRDFLACLSCFSSLHTLRLSNITRGCSQPYLTCPPLLSTLQICRCDLPHLPSSLLKFSRLTRLDLLHWRRLHSLPPFLSAFTSLRHFRVSCDGPMPHVPQCLKYFLNGKQWYEHSACDGSFDS
ncbi:unnamed protein product [Closterium sp. Naga37s-1]|nr:unnamed protein product [Closterium sp. Naga37s-1]